MESKNKRIFVSVLMTAYNREKYIADAIESVLASTYQYFELIIVDDCSQDRTIEIAKKYENQDSRVKVYVNEKNLGDYPNRNKAASYAIGKYIKYLDSDDIMYPNCLSVMVNAMEKFPDAAYGLSSIGQANCPYPICISPKETYWQHFNGFGHFDRAPGSSIINREVFIRNGGYVIPKYAGDTEFWFRLAQSYNLVLFQRDLVWDRRHSESESNNEIKDKGIFKLRKKIVNEMLSNRNCPLDLSQIKIIKKMNKDKYLSNVIRKIYEF
jgi:glycosyltransferase involved in cell wall biosynthesis